MSTLSAITTMSAATITAVAWYAIAMGGLTLVMLCSRDERARRF